MNDRTIHLSPRLVRAAGFAVLAAWAGVHPAAAQSGCGSSIAVSTACTLNGFTIYPTSDVTATVSNDTINLTNGSIYLAPTNNGNAVRSRRMGQTPTTVIVNTTYSTAGGNSPAQVGRDSTITLNNGGPAGWFLATQSGTSTSVIALVQGTLTAPASLKPGCQVTYNSSGSTTSSLSSATDSILTWMETQYSININTSGSPNCSASSIQRERPGNPGLLRAAADLEPVSRFAALPVSYRERLPHPAAPSGV